MYGKTPIMETPGLSRKKPELRAKQTQAFFPSYSSFLFLLHPYPIRFPIPTFSSLKYNLEVAKCHFILGINDPVMDINTSLNCLTITVAEKILSKTFAGRQTAC